MLTYKELIPGKWYSLNTNYWFKFKEIYKQQFISVYRYTSRRCASNYSNYELRTYYGISNMENVRNFKELTSEQISTITGEEAPNSKILNIMYYS